MNAQQMLDKLLNYKECFYSKDSDDYKYWYDYFITLDEQGLLEELEDHKMIEVLK
jgi:hypothetical protein